MADQETPVVFTGKAGEYFGIWIVNLLLSIVTLGIYSAWAKVRRKKYFYNNTLIDGVGFDYHANPIAILKGRVIAFVLFVIYNVLAGFSPVLSIIVLVLFLIAMPWIITRGMMFNARNSSHRGLRFDFDGQYGQAALVFLGYPLLIVVTLGLAMPFVMRQINKFVFDHHKFGTSHFEMEAKIKDFYMIYLKLFGAVILIGLLLSFGLKAMMKQSGMNLSEAPMQQSQTVAYQTENHAGGFMKVGNTVAAEPEVVAEDISDAELAAENAALAAEQAAAEAYTEEDYMKDLTPEERAQFEAEMKKLTEQYEAQAGAANGEMASQEPSNPLDSILGPYAMLGPIIYAAMLVGILIYAALLFSMTAYVQSRVSNLVWNNTKLDHLSFRSNQRMRDLLWLYLSNMVVLIITLGLATPWAQIRMAKYRMDHLKILGESNWDKFVGEKKENARAMGEEIAEMFDLDLSFG